MEEVRLYGLKKCSTCLKARNWLEQRGVEFSFTDYRDHPIAGMQLAAWAEKLGGWEKLVNRASMTWRQLPDIRKSPSDDGQWQTLIAEFPALIRRPLAVTGDGDVSVGFSEKKYSELFA
ncbi:Spx/MgsR family RNA polymerase-binding regulatory protein [Candidimonas sp. SYP-B2681]|uniref:Spx/MgsR family RNA polymerase-binding regulatory protein n=1 Tax=Candidimonas sp. SYP-B2681 TaxID=2497686 RepID=UPI000F87A243|nr:Spx/MgsR family RNA polymerase-binding regulatory protein [Candidimonas sp. SYP-B2681]RTZ44435.1 Spx/MgsR family RNA polymerase-binding regulatory protein [Candidimonas sp. SYP-B2681]